MRAGFQYFPENFMWSQGMMIVIEMARWGGAAMSEVDRVGKRLKDKVGDNDAWGAEWEKEARRIESMGNAAAEKHPLSAPHFQLPWVMGMPDMDAAMKKTEAYKLAGVAEKITCPFLVTHGEDDSISPVENARLLYDAVSSKKKTLKIFTAEEGGSEHCQGDNRFLGATYVADWLAENL